MRPLPPIGPDEKPAKKVREAEAAWFKEDPADNGGAAGGYSALCLSGGGIRSATFCLGVLQGLARWPATYGGMRRALESFHYLSTVSGGGYIGSWLSRWIREEPGGLPDVVTALASDDEPATIRQLRAYSSYLAPKRGLSTDAFTLLGITGRNLLLNWSVLLPAVTLLLLLPRLAVTTVHFAGDPHLGDGVHRIIGIVAFVAAALLAADIVAHVTRNLPPAPTGGESSLRFTVVLPLAAIAWSIGWAAVAPGDMHESPGARFIEFCRHVGRLLSDPGGLWSELRTPSEHGVFWACVLAGVLIPIAGTIEGMRRRTAAERKDAGWPGLLTWVQIVLAGAGAGICVFIGCVVLIPSWNVRLYVTFAMPFMLAVYWLGTVAYVGLASASSGPQGYEQGETGREWWARAGAASLRPIAWWLLLSVLVFYVPSLILKTGGRFLTGASVFGLLSAAATALAGFFGRGGVDDQAETSTWREWFQRRILPIAATIALLLGVIVISLLTSRGFYRAEVDDDLIGEGPKTEQTNREHAAVQSYVGDLATINKYPDAIMEVGPSVMADPVAKNSVEAAKADAARAKAKLGLEKFVGVPAGEGEKTLLWWSAMHDAVTGPKTVRWEVVFAAILLLALIVPASMFLGVNRFSLHNMYGNRLIRAFLGAARAERTPNRFSGFDLKDDLAMADLVEKPNRPHRLLHIVNIALNRGEAQTDEELAQQKRMATSFTVSPLYAGSIPTGFQPSATYAGRITQGRAMAISGAAVSPAMGYHSSAPVAALMTFVNIRLGWWLPNPGPFGRGLWGRSEPQLGLRPLFEELAGQSGSQSAWVYLSDGGHLDNLGLYEMARRRCRRIVVVDASQDGDSTYDDLSRTLRMIRADFGVSVDFPGKHAPTPSSKPTRHFAVGRIRYPARDGEGAAEGVLIYIKPLLGPDAPIDVVCYAAQRRNARDQFPHESTADQFFDEMQFESYRRLGLLSVEALKDAFPSLADVDVETAEETSPPDTGSPPVVNGNGGHPGSKRDSDNGWLGSLGAILAPAAVSTAIATTLVVTVGGSVQVEPPKTPLPVVATAPLPVVAEKPFVIAPTAPLVLEGTGPLEHTLHPDTVQHVNEWLRRIELTFPPRKGGDGQPPAPPHDGNPPPQPPIVEDAGALKALLQAQKEALVGIQASVDRIPWRDKDRSALIENGNAQAKALDEIREAIQQKTTPDGQTPVSLKPLLGVLGRQLTALEKIQQSVEGIPSRRNVRGVRGDD